MNFKKLLSILISFVLISGVFAVNISALEPEKELITVGYCELDEPYMSGVMTADVALEISEDVTEELRELFYNAVYNGIATVNIYKYNIYVKDLGIIRNLLFYSMPEILHAVTEYAYSYYSDYHVNNIVLSFNYAPAEIKSMMDEFELVAENMVKDIRTDKLTDMQKALILHDRLIVKNEYAYERLNNNALTTADYSAYGALVIGESVCQGYTEAYEYLLRKVGIKSVRCRSEALNHIWNIVYIDGKPYHVDTTWDDPTFPDTIIKPKGYVRHTNFLISTDKLFNNYDNYGYDVGCHQAYDYETFPTDKTYESLFCRYLEKEFLLIGDAIYYYDEYSRFCSLDEQKPLTESGIGDIDGNSIINASDVTSCRRFVSGGEDFSSKQFESSDINKDKKIDIIDLIRLKRLLLYVI